MEYSSTWHDTKILKYLLNPREKGGRGLKQMSKIILKREMIELEDLIPKSNVKDYSKLDPSWPACVLYAAADARTPWGSLRYSIKSTQRRSTILSSFTPLRRKS